ncbi:MAG: hypothetical protein JO020_21675 [Chloroflexi bacterium]|nr:hypothetical protein [Chloroflexota bacterium]
MGSRLRLGVIVVIGAATLFWLGYGVGRVQSIDQLASRTRDADTDRYSITQAGVLVHFERLGGDGKPFIRSSSGAEVVDISDWDADSRIIVDGTLFELVRLYPQSAVDYERSRIVETLNGDGWLVQREITVAADGTVQVIHSFVARRSIQRVDLAVAHTHQYFLSLQVDEVSVSATVNSLTRDQLQNGVVAAPTHRLTVRSSSEGAAAHFRYGQASAYGPQSFVADMAADNPPIDTRVLLGEETMTLAALASPSP